MKRLRPPFPHVIQLLVDDVIAAAKARGVHGRVRVLLDESTGKRVYHVGIAIDASETVPTRAPRR